MSPTLITKVALAGKGRIGTAVLSDLLKSDSTDTILIRSASTPTSTLKDTLPGVKVHEVDYASIEALKSALQGVDAVVSTIVGTAIVSQKPLIDAAIAVGVIKHFIPAD
ncbi:uncharacterized protein BDV17DRAFT_288824 [Aspergillus undulatus]|uniref:uncharacterized protein n=1 Tax=Aspergillus undulatus TaxID=1810928 RepID=UPI003CCC9893